MICQFCEATIVNAHKNRKYCSESCQYKARYAKDGQRSTHEQRRQWYLDRCKSNDYKNKLNTQGQQRYQIVQNYLRQYKLDNGCVDCGYKEHHAALEFDHIVGQKEFNVCNAKSIAQAQKEILKCEVVCSNCHKIRTFERLQTDDMSGEI